MGGRYKVSGQGRCGMMFCDLTKMNEDFAREWIAKMSNRQKVNMAIDIIRDATIEEGVDVDMIARELVNVVKKEVADRQKINVVPFRRKP